MIVAVCHLVLIQVGLDGEIFLVVKFSNFKLKDSTSQLR